MFLLNKVDGLLNSITMYRVVLYGLMILSLIAIIFGFLRLLPFSGLQFTYTLAVILVSVFVSNTLFAKITGADTNIESFWITGFILFLTLAPINEQNDLIVTILISVVAMASKYFLTYDKKHIFNPAAVGMFLAGLFGFGNSIWWVGSAVLLPFVFIIGLLVVRKIRRFQMFFTFIIFALLTAVIFNYLNGLNAIETLTQVILSWPLIFFGTIMLTEPFTTPYKKQHRTIYAILVGVLFGSQFSIGPLYASPEFALIAGNIFSFIVNPKGKLILKLKQKNKLASTIFEFVFSPEQKMNYLAGQYMEWTLPHKNPDTRGLRRYFTIASSPKESEIKLGVKITENESSTFKKALLNLKEGDRLTADQLMGDFVLGNDENEKLVFVAGGIGVTPFRSIIENFIDIGIWRDTVLFYSAADPGEFVYKDIFKKAENFGVKTVYVLGAKFPPPKNWVGETGFLTPEMIKKYVPDYRSRKYYLSGPIAMVNNYKGLLNKLGISFNKIVTDYFPGF